MKIALVCIAKDENQYFDEWIRHHLKVGFDNVIIYDNNSKEPIEIAEDLKPKVEIIEWIDTEFGSQSRAYLDACKSGLSEYDYMAFFDVDEFYMSLTMDVKKDLTDLGFVFGLGIYWRIYGNPEPFETRQPIEKYTKYYGDKHIKSIVDPKIVSMFPDPHKALVKSGFESLYVDENDNTINSPIGQHTSKKIWIKHIFTRSRQEFAEKIIRGDANTRQQNRTWNDFEHYNSLCINED